MNKYFFFIFCLLSFQTNAQEFYFSLAKNISSYDYQSSNDTHKNLEFRSAVGNSYEMGYYTNLKESNFYYAIGISYNEFNAEASDAATNYIWETKYIGIINKIFYDLNSKQSTYCFGLEMHNFVSFGINTSTLVKGGQFINNYYFDLTQEEDLFGVLLQPSIGLNSQLTVTQNFKFVFGYHYSKTFTLLNKSNEKLSYNNHQLLFGIQFNLDQ